MYLLHRKLLQYLPYEEGRCRKQVILQYENQEARLASLSCSPTCCLLPLAGTSVSSSAVVPMHCRNGPVITAGSWCSAKPNCCISLMPSCQQPRKGRAVRERLALSRLIALILGSPVCIAWHWTQGFGAELSSRHWCVTDTGAVVGNLSCSLQS